MNKSSENLTGRYFRDNDTKEIHRITNHRISGWVNTNKSRNIDLHYSMSPENIKEPYILLPIEYQGLQEDYSLF